jgi:hypothetical protein
MGGCSPRHMLRGSCSFFGHLNVCRCDEASVQVCWGPSQVRLFPVMGPQVRGGLPAPSGRHGRKAGSAWRARFGVFRGSQAGLLATEQFYLFLDQLLCDLS